MFHDVGKEEDVKLFFFAQLRRFHAAQSITAIFPYDRGIQLHAKRFEAGGEQQSEISAVAAADVQDLRVRRSVFAQHAQDAVFFSPEAIQEFADSHTRSLNFAGRYCSSVTILFDGRLCPLGAMKILYITSAYPTYWADFYGRNPGIADQPYSSQKAAILRDAFAIGDSWTNGFRALGHEAEEIFTNAGPLQRAWWKENAGRAADAFDPATVVVAQAKRFGPDVLIYDEASESLLRTLRDAVPSLRLVFGWVGSAFPPDTGIFRQFDLVLSCAPESVERLREAGVSSEHLDHAFDSRRDPSRRQRPHQRQALPARAGIESQISLFPRKTEGSLVSRCGNWGGLALIARELDSCADERVQPLHPPAVIVTFQCAPLARRRNFRGLLRMIQ